AQARPPRRVAGTMDPGMYKSGDVQINAAQIGNAQMKRKISLTINGIPYVDVVEPRLLLIHYLREIAGLTGPHIGCETSICGACTVMLDRKAVKSCTMFAVQADGRDVLTIEGLAQDGKLDP